MIKALLLKDRSFFLLLMCLWVQPNYAITFIPDSLLQPNVTISIEAIFLTSDKLQQCYVVTSSNELFKYDNNGTLLFRYNNNRLGKLQSIDVTDPFNILLFYPDYFTVVLLDRTLSITGEFQLYDLNIAEINVVGMANDNNIWLYDENAGKVKKISQGGIVLEESTNIRLSLGKNIQPVSIMEYNNRVYLNVPYMGILVFDNFGTFIKQINITNISSFQIVDNQLLYQQGNLFFSFHLKSLLTTEIQLPLLLQQNDQLRIQKGNLFLLRAKELLIYKM